MSTTREYTPPFVNREAIHAKLSFLSSAVGFMDGHRADFDENAEYALCIMLQEIANEVYPEWEDESDEAEAVPEERV